MKFNTVLFLTIFFIPSSLWAFEDRAPYQVAYNFCMTDVINKSNVGKFRRKTPKEQGEECVKRLIDVYPETLEGLDIETFKQGFFDGRYILQRK